MSAPEFSRPIDRRQLKAKPVAVEAGEAERKALARRFGLVAIDRLAAEVTLIADGKAVDAAGTLEAEIVQICAVSGDDLPVAIREPITRRFVPQREIAAE
jgi:hypothetical protein